MLNLRPITRFLALLEFRMKRAEFYRDLAEMFRRSEPMLSFLEGEISNAKKTRQKSRLAALRLILDRLQTGENASRLGHLLDGVMPRSDAMLLLAVDRAPLKAQALEALAVAVDNQNSIKRVVAGYALLPLALLPLSYTLIIILSSVIMSIKKSAPAFVQEELWSGFNGVARVLAEFIYQHGPIAFGLFVALLSFGVCSLPRWTGLLRLKLEKWPLFSLYRDLQTGLLLTSLAMLLQTGSTLKAAIEDMSGVSSRWLRWHLRRVLASLDDNPNAVIDAFSRGLLSPYLLSRATTLKRSAPTFSHVLIELGTKEGPRVLNRVKLTALTANVVVVGALAVLAGIMGLASMTVPGRFASLMEPTQAMTLKAQHAARTTPSLAQPAGAQP